MTSQQSVFEQWKRAGPTTILVAMGEVRFAAFQQNQAIGTEGLGSCSVVVIASTYGAILAHIPPRPNTASASTDPLAGDKNVQSMMDRVKNHYHHYKGQGHFPDSETFVICAWYKGSHALPDQLDIMQKSLEKFIASPMIQTYDIPVDQTPGRGTVIVIGNLREGNFKGKPFVYAEDKLISSGAKQQATTPSATQAAGSSSSPWVWDSKHNRYRRWDDKGGWIWA